MATGSNIRALSRTTGSRSNGECPVWIDRWPEGGAIDRGAAFRAASDRGVADRGAAGGAWGGAAAGVRRSVR
jgi:hypothetical protein